MFPGYILIYTEMDEIKYYSFKNIPHFIGILKSDGEYFTRISPEEIECIRCLLDGEDVIDYSKVYFDNLRIKVLFGPLKGKEGLIKSVNKRKHRVKIEVQFLGCSKIVDVGIEMMNIPLINT